MGIEHGERKYSIHLQQSHKFVEGAACKYGDGEKTKVDDFRTGGAAFIEQGSSIYT